MSKLINIIFVILFFYSPSFAQNAEDFTEKSMPNLDLPKISTSDAPIKDLKINNAGKTLENIKSSIVSTILNNRSTPSLMFDDEEISNINRAIEAFENNQQFIPEGDEKAEEAEVAKEEEASLDNEKSFIYLASIIYFSQNDWAVWINDQKITNNNNSLAREIYLSSVKNDSVAITWRLSLSKWRILSKQSVEATPPNLNSENQVELEFVLKPNQTYALGANKVIEGRAAAALLKKKEDSEKQSSQKND